MKKDKTITNFLKLNLGCGGRVIEGWVNVDYALGARLIKIPLFSLLNQKLKLFHMDWDKRILIADLRRRFPFKDNTVDTIYTSHTLEHFSQEEGTHFLKECHRVLKPNGLIRVVVPDLDVLVTKYIAAEFPSDQFVEKLGVLLPSTYKQGILKKIIICLNAFPHKCMYNPQVLLEKARKIGFLVQKRAPFDSDIDEIRMIEIESRTTGAVIIEGRKSPNIL